MKNTFRIVALIALIAVAGLFIGVPTVSAAGIFEDCLEDATATKKCDTGLVCDPVSNKCIAELPSGPQSGVDILLIINRITNWVFGFFLAFAVLYLVLGAFDFVTGSGDPTKIDAAKKKILYAVIGIALALIANGVDDVIRKIISP